MFARMFGMMARQFYTKDGIDSQYKRYNEEEKNVCVPNCDRCDISLEPSCPCELESLLNHFLWWYSMWRLAWLDLVNVALVECSWILYKKGISWQLYVLMCSCMSILTSNKQLVIACFKPCRKEAILMSLDDVISMQYLSMTRCWIGGVNGSMPLRTGCFLVELVTCLVENDYHASKVDNMLISKLLLNKINGEPVFPCCFSHLHQLTHQVNWKFTPYADTTLHSALDPTLQLAKQCTV